MNTEKLYINSTIRPDSRTDKIARALLSHLGGGFQEIKLSEEGLIPLDIDRLNRRTRLLEQGLFEDDSLKYARQFAQAKTIVISAPYWDLSFPAILKIYLENIYATGIVSEYDPSGRPRGLCQGDDLYYVVTAGGPYSPDFSYNLIKTMARDYFGIKRTHLISAQMLDVVGFNADGIVKETIDKIVNH